MPESANIRQDIHHLLKKYWNHDAFRPLQEEIILSVLESKDTLALLPTGGGKSICFQVPGLALGGTTLVISPLISLMNDQVDNLKNKGISAVAISSAMNHREIDIALNNAALGHVQFLYVSPERLQNNDFKTKLTYLPITLIAVDEAHCISQWGHDFRPSYMCISELREHFEKVPVIALTASATKQVADEIQNKLNFKQVNIFRQSFVRSNLRYVVQKEDNKSERLLKLINNLGGSGVIYVRNRKRTEDIAAWLIKNQISSMAYHAGLKYEERKEIQEAWMRNRTQVICATNAFGMGIDKPDVRFVVHLDLPESLEAYFQEAGRAGRDGKVAYATMFYNDADHQRLRDQLELAFPPIEQIKLTYQSLCNYFQVAMGSGLGSNFEFDIDKVCSSYNLQPVIVYNSIRFLEKENYVSFIDAGFEPSKVMILAGKEELYEFQVKFEQHEPLIKALLRSYGGILEDYIHVSEKDLASRAKLSYSAVVEKLNFLDKQKILSYLPQTQLPKIIFTQDRVNTKHLTFSEENYTQLKNMYRDRIETVIRYTENTKVCRQSQLLLYFNEHNFIDCGFCDVCISGKSKDQKNLRKQVLLALSKQPLTLQELKIKLMKYNEESWITALNELVDEGKIAVSDSRYSLIP